MKNRVAFRFRLTFLHNIKQESHGCMMSARHSLTLIDHMHNQPSTACVTDLVHCRQQQSNLCAAGNIHVNAVCNLAWQLCVVSPWAIGSGNHPQKSVKPIYADISVMDLTRSF